MSSEVTLVLKADQDRGIIPAVGAEIMVEINGGIIQSVRALGELPFPIRVHIKDLDLSRVQPDHPETIWLLGLPGEAAGT